MTGIAVVVLSVALVGAALSWGAGTVPWFGFGGVLSGLALLFVARRLPED